MFHEANVVARACNVADVSYKSIHLVGMRALFVLLIAVQLITGKVSLKMIKVKKVICREVNVKIKLEPVAVKSFHKHNQYSRQTLEFGCESTSVFPSAEITVYFI